MNQSKFIDVNVFYRHGGIDPQKAKANSDILVISAGIGLWISPLLSEQILLAKSIGLPYATYLIPDPADGPMGAQVKQWAAQPGVTDGVMIADIEKPDNDDPRIVNLPQTRDFLWSIDAVSKLTLVYSRVDVLSQLFAGQFPTWWTYQLLIAQYLYEYYDENDSGVQYKYFDTFLARWGGLLPPAVINSPMFGPWERSLVVGWQFSEKGDAQKYIANATTLDPIYKTGVKQADLNVSTIDRSEFIAMFPCSPPPIIVPPPPPVTTRYVLSLINDQNIRADHNTGAASIGKTVKGRIYSYNRIYCPGTLDNIWIEITYDGLTGWAALQYGRVVYFKTQ